MAKPKEKAADVGKEKSTSIDVIRADGSLVRTYSKKVHGKGFKDLAKGFVAIRLKDYKEELKLKNPGSEEEESEEESEEEEKEENEEEESE